LLAHFSVGELIAMDVRLLLRLMLYNINKDIGCFVVVVVLERSVVSTFLCW